MPADESRLPKGPPPTGPAAITKLPDAKKDPKAVTDDEWKSVLTEEEFHVCRLGGTEPSFSGVLTKHAAPGKYTCRCCGAELFVSDSKYWSGCGWPSFSESLEGDKNIVRLPDNKFGLKRTEVRCKQCEAHLGHVFDDGPVETTGERYCINSVSITFQPKAD
ncbi:Protein F44E2.6 a [Aphelenchoides avenae]|nr:Protein F44E2.6 a [Aphelenchus avenae]